MVPVWYRLPWLSILEIAYMIHRVFITVSEHSLDSVRPDISFVNFEGRSYECRLRVELLSCTCVRGVHFCFC